MGVVAEQDIEYLAQQSSGKLNIILSGMTSLMNDTDNMVESLESQNWFQRMVRTVTGKNKATKEEIKRNNEKMNAYMSEAIAELYNRSCIDESIMMSLGMQINELYADHLQLKQMLGAFVNRLNEKIDSVDNFHMLTTEIEQGVYSQYPSLLAMAKIMSQFDNRILEDDRKLDIIKRDIITQNIINANELSVKEYLLSLSDISIDDVGYLYMELGTIRKNFVANIIICLIEQYFLLDDMARKLKNISSVVDNIIKNEEIDETISLSPEDIYDDFLKSKIDAKNELVSMEEIKKESEELHAEELFLECRFEEALSLFLEQAKNGNGRAMYFLGMLYGETYRLTKEMNEDESRKWIKKGWHDTQDPLVGMSYYDFKYYDEETEKVNILKNSYDKLLVLAQQGDVFAQYELSYIIRSDEKCTILEIETDEEKGMFWKKESANNGFWLAEWSIGIDAEKEKKGRLAVEWYTKAASNNYACAMACIAGLYEEGCGDLDKDINKTIEWYKKAVDLNSTQWHSSNAAYRLGKMYDNGNHVEQDYEKAYYYYKKAADFNHKWAQNDLAFMYKEGTGVECDNEKAIYWFRKSAENGCPNAQYALGLSYKRAEGVEQDYKKANYWFEQAANQGHSYAQNALGNSYRAGYGCDVDYEMAVKWYKKAAEQNDTTALVNLGYCYENGDGVEVDKAEAERLYYRAMELGENVGKENWNRIRGVF